MALISLPDDVPAPQVLLCSICDQEKSTSELTVGLCDAQGQQAFACDSHFRSGSQFIVGWADFAARQQQILDRINMQTQFSETNTDERVLY